MSANTIRPKECCDVMNPLEWTKCSGITYDWYNSSGFNANYCPACGKRIEANLHDRDLDQMIQSIEEALADIQKSWDELKEGL